MSAEAGDAGGDKLAAAENVPGAGAAGPLRSKARTPARGAAWSSVLVSLRAIDEAGSEETSRAERYGALRALARTQRDELLAWLRTNAEADSWRKPGEVTAFGTFTLDCRPAGLRALRHAPHVLSVVRTGDAPLHLVR